MTFAEIKAMTTWGWDRHIWDIRPESLPNLRLAAWLIEFFFLLGNASTKISILLFYRRITSGLPGFWFLYLAWAAIAFTVLYTLGLLLELFFICRPPESYWKSYNPLYTKKHACGNEHIPFILSAAASITSDIYSSVLPMMLARTLQMTRRQRFSFYALFSAGLLTAGIGIARLLVFIPVTKNYQMGLHTHDVSWLGWPLLALTDIEAHLAIIIASLPALKVLFRHRLSDPFRKISGSLRTMSTSSRTPSGMSSFRSGPSRGQTQHVPVSWSKQHIQDEELQRQASQIHDSHQRYVVRESPQPATNARAEQRSASCHGDASFHQRSWSHASSQADPPQTAVNALPLAAVDFQHPEPDLSRGEFRTTVSTWAFCRAARGALLPGAHQGVQYVQDSHDKTYQASRQTAPAPHFETASLPSKSYINHLAHVCDFRLNTSHYCFNLLEFQQRLDRTDLALLGTTSSAFHAEILAILALGKLFLEKGASTLGPPGIHQFQGATSALPNIATASEDPISIIETLLLLSIYSQAADMHHAAYLYIGQAASLARSIGLSKDARTGVGSSALGPATVRKIWWTICLLEQKQALTIGAESEFLYSEHTKTTSLVGDVDDDADGSVLHRHVCIAELMTRVTSVLNTDSKETCTTDALMTKTLIQLEAAQKQGELLSSSHRLCEGQDFSTISRPIATLHLAYYRAILHATKQFLLDVVSTTFSTVSGPRMTVGSGTKFKILKSCVKAAAYSLNILQALHEQGLLETYNFDDLEATITCGLTLTLANGVFSSSVDDSFLAITKNTLQDMSNRGNLPAEALLQEFNAINDMVTKATSTRPTGYPLSLQLSLHLTHNGQALNNCIMDVLATESPVAEVSDPNRSQTQDHSFSSMAEAQQPLDVAPQDLTSARDLDPMNHTMVESGSTYPAPEFSLDDFDDFQVQFDLDVMRPGSDGWLDFV
ncbi:hypothetical protein PV08_04031 [Exophiala spinifera]|uniref:Uncharacterized protein n=1 Tax=Exophiala spinifera TaxID=91928 RepID=A0A0D1YNY1_9EURO|nr:uncharacterized protein PV08_04031 [Exophiala spinifera]KIW16841.1 hypothetical protein PV08_04031 [Exophiala spinifera]